MQTESIFVKESPGISEIPKENTQKKTLHHKATTAIKIVQIILRRPRPLQAMPDELACSPTRRQRHTGRRRRRVDYTWRAEQNTTPAVDTRASAVNTTRAAVVQVCLGVYAHAAALVGQRAGTNEGRRRR